MKFYLTLILSCVILLYYFIDPTIRYIELPQKWAEHCYSKSKFSILWNKFYKNKLDVFYEIGIYVQTSLVFTLIIILIVDFCLKQYISNYLESCPIVVFFVVSGPPVLYPGFIKYLWSTVL